MTTATLLPRLQGESQHLGIGELVTAVFEGIMEGREIATRYERLSRLSNAELARLGLTRQDIPSAAVNGLKGF
jgi:hypothetical protein